MSAGLAPVLLLLYAYHTEYLCFLHSVDYTKYIIFILMAPSLHDVSNIFCELIKSLEMYVSIKIYVP